MEGHEREKSIRGRRTGGGGSAGGGTGTGITGGGSAGGSSRTGVAGGTKGKEGKLPLHTDTIGAKVTEGTWASKNGAGGESPGEDE